MPNNSLMFLVCALAVWRATHLIAREDGPFDVVVRLRAVLGNRFLGRLLDCFTCLSFWIAAPPALWFFSDAGERIVAWFGLSGAAILLERFTASAAVPRRTVWRESAKVEYELLLRQ